MGDSSMHSLDTVKTRQQGLLIRPEYNNMVLAYKTIFRQEGFFRGLYGGYTPAILGSFPSTAAFFGAYELTKRSLIGMGMNETMLYLAAGVVGDLALSVFYVPLEVLKTRLQLQGKHNNPYTVGCGYNYRNLRDAVTQIRGAEGLRALLYGYKETLVRDLPFSGLQLAFYERFRQLAMLYDETDGDLPVGVELCVGAAAGGLAGTLTTPLDVIKTRIQTNSLDVGLLANGTKATQTTVRALRQIYISEGVLGLFLGVGPRFIWTGVQSSIMLLLYQVSLRNLNRMCGT